MTEFLDANLILRYLTSDPPDHAARATALIDSDTEFVLTDTALAEVAYVLRSQYGATREETVDSLIDLVRKSNIRVWNIEQSIVIDALLLCRPSGRVGIPDALIWAAARSERDGRVWTFDERFPDRDIKIGSP